MATPAISTPPAIDIRIGLRTFLQWAFVGFSLTMGGFVAFAAFEVLALAIRGGFKAWGIG
jgi:hypothetical protein